MLLPEHVPAERPRCASALRFLRKQGCGPRSGHCARSIARVGADPPPLEFTFSAVGCERPGTALRGPARPARARPRPAPEQFQTAPHGVLGRVSGRPARLQAGALERTRVLRQIQIYTQTVPGHAPSNCLSADSCSREWSSVLHARVSFRITWRSFEVNQCSKTERGSLSAKRTHVRKHHPCRLSKHW